MQNDPPAGACCAALMFVYFALLFLIGIAIGWAVSSFSRESLPAIAVTAFVTAAVLTARRWLQRRRR